MSSEKVEVKEEQIVIPTYERGPDDLHPPLLERNKVSAYPSSELVSVWIYPYPIQENVSGKKKVNRSYKAVILENQYLRIIVLPEIGGRIYSILNKTTRRQVLYYNDVIKYARIALRGAWIAGGVEFNFPYGHTVTTVSPINYVARRNQDGSATIIISDLEKISRMKWAVGITLYPNRCFWELEIKLFNRTNLEHPYWFWVNAGIPATPDWRFISPGRKVVSHRSEILSFPIYKGKDISWVRKQKAPIDFFSIDLEDDFFGCYHSDLDTGIIQVADRNEVQGRKMFTWGTQGDGLIWENLLTDNGGPHGEIQSGHFSTMMVRHMLPPHYQISWKEWWWPCRNMHGGFVYANRDVAFNVWRVGKKIGIALNSTSKFIDASLDILQGSKIIRRIKVNVSPECPFLKILDNLSPVLIEEIGFLFLDSHENEVAHYNPRKIQGSYPYSPTVHWLPFPQLKKGSKVQDYLTRAVTLERMDMRREAEAEYRRALKVDSSCAGAHFLFGRFLLRRGRPSEAAKHLRLAFLEWPFSAKTLYYLALALEDQGNLEEAWDLLIQAHLMEPSFSLIDYVLAEIATIKGNLLVAGKYLRRVISYSPKNIRAITFLGLVLRKLGKERESAKILRHLLEENPTEEWTTVEYYFVSRALGLDVPSTPSVRELLFDDQTILEIANEYLKLGFVSEALEILEGAQDSKWPILHYWIGYCRYYLEDSKGAINAFQRGSELDSSYVFPHRPESLKILQLALQMRPRDPKIENYIGDLLCSMGDEKKAAEWWKLSIKHDGSNGVVWGCLGLYLWKVEKNKERALQAYNRAIGLSPLCWRLLVERDDLLAELGRHAERANLLEAIPKSIIGWEKVAVHLADALLFTQRLDRCIKLLKETSVNPWEGEERANKIYFRALIERGCLRMRAGDFSGAVDDFKESFKFPLNLGKGEPAKYKERTQSYYLLGIAFEKSGNKEKAFEWWKNGIAQEERLNSESHFYQALCYSRLGRTKESEEILQALEQFYRKNIAESLIPNAESHYILSLIYATQRSIEEAYKEVSITAKILPIHYGANAFLRKFPSFSWIYNQKRGQKIKQRR